MLDLFRILLDSTPEPIAQDTHDGFWAKQWEKLNKKKKPKLSEIIEIVKESPVIAFEEVKEAVKIEYPSIDYTDVINNIKLQTFIAKQILAVYEMRKQEEDDLEIILLSY